MSCGGCGKSSCRGCKDIKVLLPAGRGISTVTDNGDGNWLITYTDATTELVAAPAVVVPNDSWIDLDETDMSSITFSGTATHTSTAIDLTYKIIAEDAVIIKCFMRIEATITGLTNTLQNSFRFPALGSSNFFVGTKLLTGMTQRVPISLYSSGNVLNPTGCVTFSNIAGVNLISIGETNLQIPNGDYTFDIHFESICKIA